MPFSSSFDVCLAAVGVLKMGGLKASVCCVGHGGFPVELNYYINIHYTLSLISIYST